MNPLHLLWRGLILGAVVCFACRLFAAAPDEPTLTKEQIKQFLLTAKVVSSHESQTGVTRTSRLTLSDGTLTHDASLSMSRDPSKSLTAVKRNSTLLTLTSTISPLMRWRSWSVSTT